VCELWCTVSGCPPCGSTCMPSDAGCRGRGRGGEAWEPWGARRRMQRQLPLLPGHVPALSHNQPLGVETGDTLSLPPPARAVLPPSPPPFRAC
jgi:hypothetical protein